MDSPTDRSRTAHDSPDPQGAPCAATRRKPFAPPRLERHDTLAAITAEQTFNFGGS